MSLSNMGVENILREGFNAFQFSLMGMLLVFSGLIVIALYIILLPKLLNGKSAKKASVKANQETKENTTESEILLAIASAYHMHRSMPGGNDRITLKTATDSESPWLVSGRMNSLGMRKPLSPWRKK